MMPRQLLRAGRASQAGLGLCDHHGPGALVPDSDRRQRDTLQQLNQKLASYLQQVECLETANQRLEHQIQEELDRKCPRELKQLDGHLRTASLLQDQITGCLLDQAQMKLQLLGAELSMLDLNIRCEKERKRRGCVEAELSDLRLVEEVLKVHILPELRTLLNHLTQQLTQYQQDIQGLLAQVSGGFVVAMQSPGSSDLVLQLDHLRQTSVTLLNQNQNQNWFNTQLSSPPFFKVSMLSSSAVTFDPPEGSKLEELRRTAVNLEEELTHLEALNVLLKFSGLELTQSFIQQLLFLQQRADGLSRDLDSVLQAADHKVLLDGKNRLETQIQDYRRLLDQLSLQGVSSLQPVAHVTSTRPPLFTRHITANNTTRIQGGNLRMTMGVSRGHVCANRQTPVIAPLSEPLTTVQSIRVHSKHSKNSAVRSINTSNRAGSFHKAENQRTGAVPERTVRDSMTISTMITRQSSPVEDEVHTKCCEMQSSSTDAIVVSQGSEKRAVVEEINSAPGITMLVPHTQSARRAAAQAKPESLTSKQTITEAGLQANIHTEITKTSLCVEPQVKEGPHFRTHTTTDSSKEAAAEVKKETETQMDSTEGFIQTKNQDPAQVVSLRLKTPAETVLDSGDGAVTASTVSADMKSGIATASSGNPDSKHNLEITTARDTFKKFISGFHDTNNVKVDPSEIVNLAGQEELSRTTKSKHSVSLTDSGVALSSSDHEDILSPSEAHVFVCPTKSSTCLSPEKCLSPAETDVFMSRTNQVFYPVDPEEHAQSLDSLLSPNDPQMFLSPNDSDTCFSPAEVKGCLSPNSEEEDDEVSLNLTEANTHVRPVEKYILSTKEDGRSRTFCRDQALSEEGRKRKVNLSERDGDRLCFGSFEGNKRSRDTLNGKIIKSRPTSREISFQLSSSLGGLEFGGAGGRSIIAEKEEQLGFGGVYRKRDARSARDSEKVFVKPASFGSVPADGESTVSGVTSNSGDSGMTSDLALCLGGMAADSSVAVIGNTKADATAEVQGRLRIRSGDWMVYGGSLGCTSTTLPSTKGEESPSGATLPSTSRPETGRFVSRGGGEWMVYGRKSSLLQTGSEENLSVIKPPATSSPDRMVHSGSLKISDSLPITESRERQSMAMKLPTSPPEMWKFGSRGSGEWRVYGRSSGCMSGVTCSGSLPNADSEESPSVAIQPATSPPGAPGAPGARRFGSEDSGEWRVYGVRLSSVSNVDRVSASYGQIISPPSNYTSSGPRLSSAGSGGKLTSGSVVRRSSSVGSGGRSRSSGSSSKLSSSSRSSSSGRFTTTGSGESHPVYSSANRRRSTVVGGGTTSSQRAPSPCDGWLSSSAAGRSHLSSSGGGATPSRAGSNDRISSQTGVRISSSSRGKVISSSDRPIRSTGSGAGSNKERISVCKMAALSISAAGKERGQDRQQQQQQHAADSSPLFRRWLTTAVRVQSAEHNGLDDIMHL